MARGKEQTTALADWEKDLAAAAALAAEGQRAAGGGGKFFSMKAGQLSFDGNAFPGNQMAAIIIADVMENSYYDDVYDPDTPASPKCFAFGKVESEMEPHTAVDNDPYFERQSAECAGCPNNEWGSAATGRGKACKNVMRLALIPAGQYVAQGKGRNAGLELELYEDPEHFEKAEIAFMKLPVMSVKNYGAYVKALNANVKRPPFAVFTNIAIEPDAKSQFKVVFELIEVVPNELLPAVMARHKEAQPSIDFPYGPPREAEGGAATATTQRAANKLRGKAKPAAKKR